MKKLVTFLFFTAMYVQVSFAQEFTALITDLNLLFMAKDDASLDYTKFAGKEVAVNVIYSAEDGTLLYTEDHAGTLDHLSGITFQIGAGSNPQPVILSPDLLRKVDTLSWNGILETDAGPISFTGEKAVTPINFANFAHYAGDSDRFGGNAITEEPKTFLEILAEIENTRLVTNRYTGIIEPSWIMGGLPLNEIMNLSDKTSAVTNNPIQEISFGNSGIAPVRTFAFGNVVADEVENKFTFCTKSGPDFRHVVGIINKADRGSTDHNTASLFLSNEEPEKSIGLFAKANTWAAYLQGNNGMIGITTGLGNGAAAWGYVGSAPATGGFKYAVLGDAQNQPNSLAGYFVGPVTITGTLTNPSDANLKSEIRSQTNSLQQVMRLRPATFTYKQDTPYSLPEGLHYGFIAQEVEEVLPELVSDLNMPLSLDPEKMATSGTSHYKGIHYIELISILTSALQELNTNFTAKIDAQAAEIAELRQMIEEIVTKK